ncbi:hypothetical protein ZWY2020_015682 [Hordeum vulgare]|nr:hypothetical protein ZWY2020_015682 [Hordeum vulgare]
MDAPLHLLLSAAAAVVVGASIHPGDLAVLEDLRGMLTNSEVHTWPKGDEPCGDGWAHVSYDRDGRVNNLDLKSVGLAGALSPPHLR